MALKTTVSGRIAKPIGEVFEAVVNPDQLKQFFTTGGASGRLEAGKTVTWDFHDFPGVLPVKVAEVVLNKKIVLHWGAADDAPETEKFVPRDSTVTLEFEQLEDGRTLVTITEEGWRETPKGIKAALGNTEGWTGMLAAMRVWLEHGIHFREGFYK